MLWALENHEGQGPMNGGRIIRQGAGDRINLIACGYISSIEKEFLASGAKKKDYMVSTKLKLPGDVQEQSFISVLKEAAPRNFPNFRRKFLYRSCYLSSC